MTEQMNLTEQLKHYFGFDSFKGDQESIIKNLMSGNDTFVLMPTGGGKSLCYQLPSLIMEGTAIVVSPLIALMKNQVDVINGLSEEDGVAHYLNSSLNKSAIEKVKSDILSGKTKLLYVAPESLTKEDNVDFLKDVKISFYAIDEAHCISEWGHDFRPEYRRIRPIINEIGNAPVIALTATATDKVRTDIKKSLGIMDAKEFKSSFNRPNLYYEVRPKTNEIDKQIIMFIRQHAGKSGIIYCLSRKKVEELAEVLKANEIKAAPYHAGLDSATRSQTQDDFLMERIDVIVATIAFGMGIDKPDVRFVIHYDIPKSLEGYKQIFLCQQTSSVSADIDKNIMPDLIKLSHNGYKMMKSNVLEDTSVEEIVDSEMEDRLMDKLDKTMEKMQVRRDAGLDVNYSTFSKMKNYAFFHRFSNWFVPFTIDHPDMSQLKKALGDKADFMISIAGSTMSEGDKYSLLFSLQDVLERMPQYKDMIFPKSVNPPKSEDFDFLQNDAVALRRNYLQDLYRFFQLAPMRNGFPNPFVNESNSWIDPAFLSSDVFTDFDDLDDVHLSVCRFLAKSKNYVELNHYLRNFSLDSDDGVVLKALCMMHVKKRYDIAVFLLKPIFDKNPGNVAVGKLLVKCYLQQDKYKEALDIFDALSDKLGDNPSLLLSKIDCLRSTYLYSEALKVAYELDYKYPNNRMYMLLLVRVLLDNNEIEKAGEELNKLVMMLQEEKVDDYNEELFLLGIIEWCRGHLKDAQDSMRGYALVNKDNRNKVFSRIAEFKRLLLGHNVTQVEYAMMLNLIDNHFTAK